MTGERITKKLYTNYALAVLKRTKCQRAMMKVKLIISCAGK